MTGRPNGGSTATEAGENDKSRGTREPHGQDQSFPTKDRKASGFTQRLKQQFRDVVKALTRHGPAPQPTKRRRRSSGETRGGFTLAAAQLVRRVVRSIFHAGNFTWDVPAEPDDTQRLHLWQLNLPANVAQSHEIENFQHSNQNHLSPHL
jgi:hypothetical protein